MIKRDRQEPARSEPPARMGDAERPTRLRPSRALAGSNPALGEEEIRSAIDPAVYPPIMDVHQAAALFGLSHHTIYKAVSEGRFRGAVHRGKPLRFWRDRLIRAFFAS